MIKNDAVRIYSKYISEDASCSINITDHLRKVVLGKLFNVGTVTDYSDFYRYVMKDDLFFKSSFITALRLIFYYSITHWNVFVCIDGRKW